MFSPLFSMAITILLVLIVINVLPQVLRKKSKWGMAAVAYLVTVAGANFTIVLHHGLLFVFN